MKKITITIARQYGSGGRTVGIRLAEQLGIHYYDKELTKLASEESGIAESLFLDTDERFRNKGFLRTPVHVYNSEIIGPESPDFTSPDNLFNLQARCIKRLAETEPCVIVGRAADFVLKDYDNVLSVFVHAPHDFLMEQAGKVQPLKGKELEKFCAREDKYRADYYKHHTGQDWTDAMNYDLCLDSSKLGFDKCVEAIKAHARVRFGEDVFD
ncbi:MULTISPECIES: cytidylate kinase-like family protein [unclassified Butyrivibrio]|uniref:cytidylate kinase-like family protein n=1 Tax=unclassified Butyrivibrio TaxID=2639466 RepID=UPI0003F5BBBF|nr:MULTISPECIES: cytidylate kinase-like family protein [unclassified Butyrivibrio]SCY40163.1 Cytidylate kinase [Butyrivibrio sp. INlla14]